MPTGYTEKVVKGEMASFADFAWQCSRAMGVAVNMRDEPLSVRTPEVFELESYYSRAVGTAKARVQEIRGWSALERENEFRKYNASVRKSFAEDRAESREAFTRCSDMLLNVLSWDPPTPDHEGFKDFMIGQLTDTLDFDGKVPDAKYYTEATDVSTFYADTLDDAQKSYSRAVTRLHEASIKNDERNRWVADLKSSLEAWKP
jgi:hypothetical protein